MPSPHFAFCSWIVGYPIAAGEFDVPFYKEREYCFLPLLLVVFSYFQ